MNTIELDRLQTKLGYQFKDKSLLKRALTHRSKSKDNNERLEFLGDALLEIIISDNLYHARKEANEGELTRLRATLVRGATLAELAGVLELKNVMIVGSGELRTGGYQRDSVVADAFEAIIAAIYIDSGDFYVVRNVVSQLFENKLASLPEASVLKDSKTKLQEYLQNIGKEPPIYTLLDISGPDHGKRFRVTCSVDTIVEQAIGSSKKKAEQEAAKKVLERINDHI